MDFALFAPRWWNGIHTALKMLLRKECGFDSRPRHHVGNCKFEGFASLRSATNSYSILGVKTNSRFRILGEENFFIIAVV